MNSTIKDVNVNRPLEDDCVFGHGIAVDGNAGLNPVEGLVVSGNRVSGVYGIARPNCSADPCSHHVTCEAAGFRYRFEVSAQLCSGAPQNTTNIPMLCMQGIEVGDSSDQPQHHPPGSVGLRYLLVRDCGQC